VRMPPIEKPMQPFASRSLSAKIAYFS
jgi:hypothetical protein